jgi:hypothetical protein
MIQTSGLKILSKVHLRVVKAVLPLLQGFKHSEEGILMAVTTTVLMGRRMPETNKGSSPFAKAFERYNRLSP